MRGLVLGLRGEDGGHGGQSQGLHQGGGLLLLLVMMVGLLLRMMMMMVRVWCRVASSRLLLLLLESVPRHLASLGLLHVAGGELGTRG